MVGILTDSAYMYTIRGDIWQGTFRAGASGGHQERELAMGSHFDDRPNGYRIWITHCAGWRPRNWYDVPPAAVALSPLGEECCTADDAALLVEGFNRRMLASPGGWWAVAVPVWIRYEGDLVAGQPVGWRHGALQSAR
jgi:NADPH-dependent 2,4-dienoyl-CoA reductase/sulfur reductase-like enzyme